MKGIMTIFQMKVKNHNQQLINTHNQVKFQKIKYKIKMIKVIVKLTDHNKYHKFRHKNKKN